MQACMLSGHQSKVYLKIAHCSPRSEARLLTECTHSPHSQRELQNFWVVAVESRSCSRQATPVQLAGSCSHDLGTRTNTVCKGLSQRSCFENTLSFGGVTGTVKVRLTCQLNEM